MSNLADDVQHSRLRIEEIACSASSAFNKEFNREIGCVQMCLHIFVEDCPIQLQTENFYEVSLLILSISQTIIVTIEKKRNFQIIIKSL